MKTTTMFLAATLCIAGIAATTLPVGARPFAPGAEDAPRAERTERQRAGDDFRADRRGGDRPGHDFRRGRFGPPPPPHHGPGMPGHQPMIPFWRNDDLSEDLGLTESQIESLEASFDVTKEQLDATKGSIADAARALHEEMRKDNPDLDTVYELSDAMTAATSEKKRIVLGHMVTVKNILSEEQEEKLKGNVRHEIRERFAEGADLREEIRSIIESTGSIEDVKALLEDSALPPQAQERILERVERHLSGELPPPPPPRDGFRRGPAPDTEEGEFRRERQPRQPRAPRD